MLYDDGMCPCSFSVSVALHCAALRAGYLAFTRLCPAIKLVAYGVSFVIQEIEIS